LIPAAYVQAWNAKAPWPDARQVEQDLIICRALCDLFNAPVLNGKIAFRSTLEIEFKKGGTYQYFEVPESLFSQMQAAGSKGQFFAQNIKGIYRYARA
jgi:hypothetical protein